MSNPSPEKANESTMNSSQRSETLGHVTPDRADPGREQSVTIAASSDTKRATVELSEQQSKDLRDHAAARQTTVDLNKYRAGSIREKNKEIEKLKQEIIELRQAMKQESADFGRSPERLRFMHVISEIGGSIDISGDTEPDESFGESDADPDEWELATTASAGKQNVRPSHPGSSRVSEFPETPTKSYKRGGK